MENINLLILIITILWLIFRPFYLRYKVKKNKSLKMFDIPQIIIFPLFFLIWIILGLSALHLIWIFPFSFIAGLRFIETSFGLKISIYFLSFLGG